ncbi:MAG: hypothetical protein ABIS35_03025 [Terracoccus sp.]
MQRDVIANGVVVAGIVGPGEPFVDVVGFVAPAGQVTLVPTDPGTSQVALALAVGGRVRLAAGSITVGGVPDADLRRLRTRLVDLVDVTSPEESLSLRAVVAEELALAERPASRRDVSTFLADRRLEDRARVRWGSLPAGLRTRLLLELAARHRDVRVLVLAGPDRHGGDPREWHRAATGLADRGLTVIALCSPSTVDVLSAHIVEKASA